MASVQSPIRRKRTIDILIHMRHLESNLQQACVHWFRLQHSDLCLNLFAVPNGMHTGGNIRQAKRARAEGMTAGVSDLILLVPRGDYHALCIEMKYGKGRQSIHQTAWQKAVEREGYKYVVIRSIEEFIREVNTYLKSQARYRAAPTEVQLLDNYIN